MNFLLTLWERLPPWPYLVGLGPALACLLYRLKKTGVAGFFSNLTHATIVYSGIVTAIILGHVAFTESIPWQLSLKEKVVLFVAAVIVGAVVGVQGLRRTPLGDRIRKWMHATWWGPRHIVESHPFAGAILDLRLLLSSLGNVSTSDTRDTAKLLGLREEVSGIQAKLVSMIAHLHLLPTVTSHIADKIEECRCAFAIDDPDRWDLHICRTAVKALCGSLEGVAETIASAGPATSKNP
jgi:hypothetical protein